MEDQFAGKVALITGGTGGLGRAVSLAFLKEGATVVVTYRSEPEMQTLRAEAGTKASSLTGVQVDLAKDVAAEELVGKIVGKYGRIDVLVNAIGAYSGGSKLWETMPAEFDRMLALNLRAGFTILHAALPVMVKQASGAIVNVASRAAVDHAGGSSGYAASKAAAVAMVDSLAADLMGTGVRANSILPSIIDTAANRKAMPNADFSKWPKPEEITSVILFLCSDEARLIHGASVPVYGQR
jgi:NAD(P)-dependent dehydrogenase (short-subunit alcohol dehydrogenase family)